MHVNSQNLVYNGSAEILKDCEIGLGSVFKAVGWITPNQGSTDVLNRCATIEYIQVPKNIYGYEEPIDGDGYFGIGVSSIDREKYEYLHSKLKSTLEKDTIYEVSFYVSPADGVGSVYVDRIGALFTSYTIEYIPLAMPLTRITETPQIESEPGKMLRDTTGWTLVKDTFRAKGDEEYITLGFFNSFEDMTVVQKPGSAEPPNGFYTYIDPIVVQKWILEIEPIVEVPNVFTPNGDGQDDLFYVNTEYVERFEVQIFNRWGRQVFSSKDPEIQWDGTLAGQVLADGVYFVTVVAITEEDRHIRENHAVHLFR
jgi:gliding motility-associated-like protein